MQNPLPVLGSEKVPHQTAPEEDIQEQEPTGEVQREDEVLDLARQFTTRSIQGSHQSPFTAEPDGPLDPKSANFKAKQWAKAFYNVRYNAKEGAPARVAGLSFKNLNVWGYGSPTDYQMSVGNAIFKLPSLLGYGRKKIEILHDVEGLLLPGEMLCV